ncbi:hypothetical protein CMALT394_30160 [Carnobacterium maltaromaticum]|nr:hypothetical protein CMALT394_30160 [Carnobacterium maltaromaticum]
MKNADKHELLFAILFYKCVLWKLTYSYLIVSLEFTYVTENKD